MLFFSPRARSALVGVLVLFFVITLRRRWQARTIYRTSSSFPPLHRVLRQPVIDTPTQIRFWRSLEFILTNNGPDIPRPEQNGSLPAIEYNAESDHEFEELISMPDEEVQSMAKGHENYKKALRVHQLDLVYRKNTRGIVCTAGGSYLPLVVITLRMLQNLGSTLPMEVFLESGEEYESHVCETIFPPLNARCVILSEILNAAPHPIQIGRFQLKLFALLFSSFEEVLFLDADSIPLRDPVELFKTEPFKSKGMIIWPDFWYPSPSKYFFQITGLPKPEHNSLRAASESGEILISKRTHPKTLLVAACYNYWGPDHYYPLLAQGGPGEGDKETFLVAAQLADEAFYDVSEKILAIGNQQHNSPDDMIGSAMVQFDPVQDYRLISQGLWRTKNPTVASSPKPMFIHINLLKFNPGRVYDEGFIMRWPNGTFRRAWTMRPETIELLEFDVERMFWEESKWVACNLEDRFKDWYGQEDICRKARQHWQALFGRAV